MEQFLKANYYPIGLDEGRLSNLKLTISDYKRGTGKSAVRRIFTILDEKHKYDIFEMQQLEEFKNEYDIDIPDSILLRFLYASRFDNEKTMKRLLDHQAWLDDPKNFQINITVHELLQSGAVYFGGRGKQEKPIIIINAELMDSNRFDIQDIITSIVIMFSIVQRYALFPGLVETWIVIVDASKTSAFNIPFNRLSDFILTFQMHFPCYLDRIFILKPPTSIQISWQIVEQFIPYDTRHKIEFVTHSTDLLHQYVPGKALQIRHGGHLDNIYDHWPPHNIKTAFDKVGNEIDSNKIIRIQMIKKSQQSTARIPTEVQDVLSGQQKPKNKIYIEETYNDPSEYYRHKQAQQRINTEEVSKTISRFTIKPSNNNSTLK